MEQKGGIDESSATRSEANLARNHASRDFDAQPTNLCDAEGLVAMVAGKLKTFDADREHPVVEDLLRFRCRRPPVGAFQHYGDKSNRVRRNVRRPYGWRR